MQSKVEERPECYPGEGLSAPHASAAGTPYGRTTTVGASLKTSGRGAGCMGRRGGATDPMAASGGYVCDL